MIDPLESLFELLGNQRVVGAFARLVDTDRSSAYGFERHRLLKGGNYAAALERPDLRLPGLSAEMLARRGRAQRLLDRGAAARRCLDEALARDSGCAPAWAWRWELELGRGRTVPLFAGI